MPRKEGPSLEERMQRAKELFELKQGQKEKRIRSLYASGIYKLARKTSITFLWIAQLILIDWVLPYREMQDKITGGYFNSNTIPEKGIGGITDYKLTELFIKTEKGNKFTVNFPDNTKEPAIGDTILIGKSFLLHDLKKIEVPRIKEYFLITNSLTYKYLPLLLIISALAAMFIFIKNIEVKAVAWFILLSTVAGGLFFLYRIIFSFQY